MCSLNFLMISIIFSANNNFTMLIKNLVSQAQDTNFSVTYSTDELPVLAYSNNNLEDFDHS